MAAKKRAVSKPLGRDARNVVAQARSGRRRGTVLWVVATVVVAAALLGVVIFSIARNGGTHSSEQAGAASLNNPPATVAVGADNPPPWPAPTDASAAVRAAGLPMLSAEGAVEHIHAHLDVLVDGRAVPVPANIGIDGRSGNISPLHTHDDSGVIHIESPVKRQFSLAEFFTEWQVGLSSDNIGGLRATDGKTLRVLVNGQLRQGNPAAITFAPHDEIAIVYGTPLPGETIPATYDFPSGE